MNLITFNPGKLKSQLKRHEGLRLNAYQDSEGVWTIGYGRNLQEMTITQAQADEWLKQDISSASNELNKAFPWVDNLSEKRRRVLVNMSFNLGMSKLIDFKKMWKALEKRDYHEASMEMLDSKWAVQVGSRASELAFMMIEG